MLAHEDYEDAIALLTDALKMIAARIRREDNFPGHSSPLSWPTFHFLSNPEESFLHDDHPLVYNSSDLPRFVFRDPIQVCIPSNFQPSSGTYEVLSYVVLYNLALSWHLSGISSVGNDAVRNVRLQKALDLYGHANSVMTNGQIEANPLHYMGMLCNIGQICSVQGNIEQAEACFRLLLSAIMCLVDSGVGAENHTQLEGFISNVMPIILKENTAPAA